MADDEDPLAGIEARVQILEYARLWKRDADALAPLLSKVLRAVGRVYESDGVEGVTISTEPAELFVGVASPIRPLAVYPARI